MSKKITGAVSHRKRVVEELRADPELAQEYVRGAMEDDDPGTLLIALRNVAEARGGMAKIAKESGVPRESLYRALSKRGNPRLSTLAAVLKAAGLKLSVSKA